MKSARKSLAICASRTLSLATAFIALVIGESAWARNFRPDLIPNGRNFVSDCAACHIDPGGGGPRNLFGQAVEAELVRLYGNAVNNPNPFWSDRLATVDSDGDGYSNGQELGDPTGTWLPGNADPPGPISNPGDASSTLPNAWPLVSLTSPTNGAVFSSPASVTLEALATDTDGSVTNVEFFDGVTALGNDTTPLYSVAAVLSAVGDHRLRAVATDNFGIRATSAVVTVTVQPPGTPPTAAIKSPTNGASFVAPASVTIEVLANDAEGSVTNVGFFNGAVSLGSVSAFPFNLVTTLAYGGTHLLTAVATDDVGWRSTSAVVAVTVEGSQLWNVAVKDAAFIPGSSTIQVGDTVRWTAQGSLNHTVTSVDGLFSPGNLTNGNGSTYEVTFTNAGTYHYLCAYHTSGSITSQRGTIIVLPGAAPIVTITSPTNGATFTTHDTITLTATALDPNGQIVQVEFFNAGESLGIATGVDPFSLIVSLPPGTNEITATVTDNENATTTSSPISIVVKTVPVANPIPDRIAKGDITIELKTIADGMISPLGMAVPDDGSGRMFVYDQVGLVWVVTSAGRSPTPLLDLRARLVNISGSYDERGLLGLIVHSNFAANPVLYTYTSEPAAGPADFPSVLPPGATNNHQSVIAEWQMDPANPDQADPATRREVLRIDKPQSNHNGGTMRFGPDGLLYFSLGDGGQADDQGNGHSPGGNGQNISEILGSVIRIDVDGNDSANGQYGIPSDNPFYGWGLIDEIFAYGLRNPFSFSFDRDTGDLYLGDVGQNKVEEIDIIQNGGNYGWNIKEGTFYFDPNGAGAGYVTDTPVRSVPPDLVDPIAQYDHDDGTAIIGGYVYRGSEVPALAGRYLFGDWGLFGSPSGRLYYLDTDSTIKELRLGLEDRPLGRYLKGFGQDAAGELYVFAFKPQGPSGMGGTMCKIVPPPASALAMANGSVTNGTNFQTVWSGGIGPFAQQRKTILDEPGWMNEAFVPGGSATVAVRGPSGFFRALDTAQQRSVPFSARLNGANERPTPVTTSGDGFALFSLDGNSLTFTITYRGLSGPATLAHVHGPAPATNSAGVLINLEPYHNGAFGADGSFSGTVVLSDTQKAHLLAGLAYVNIHTEANPGGEIRGQIAPVLMQASLLGTYETPAVDTPARDFGFFTLVGDQLTFNLTYRDLSSPATMAHIHGSAPLGQNAGVQINLEPFNGGAYGRSGSVSGSVVLTPAQLAMVIDGQTYVNFHTAAHSGGEIRGQIVPQSTAVPFTASISGLNERPTPLTNTAAGLGFFSLEGDTLAFSITYGGLSGPATFAHIHGPSAASASAGVQIDLVPFNNGAFGISCGFSGAITLTPAQRNMVLSSQTYVNIHTAANPGGEARGQIAPVLMSAGASGPAERPVSIVTAGSAVGLFTLVGTQLDFNVVYRDLSDLATGAHIHAPATASQTTNVVVNFAPFNGGAYGASGSVSGSTNLPATVANHLIDGLGYMNFHTATNAGGEIRGQISR